VVRGLRSLPLAADRAWCEPRRCGRFHPAGFGDAERLWLWVWPVGRGSSATLTVPFLCGSLPGWANGPESRPWLANRFMFFFIAPTLVISVLLLARGTHTHEQRRAVAVKAVTRRSNLCSKKRTQTGLTAEIKIVPLWAWRSRDSICRRAGFLQCVVARHAGGPPHGHRPLLGLLAGIGGSCFLLLIGYINRDAKRRGMSPTLWTIMAVIILQRSRIILYFCCGNAQQRLPAMWECRPDGSTSASLQLQAESELSACQRVVGINDVYCPYCGLRCAIRRARSGSQRSFPVNEQ